MTIQGLAFMGQTIAGLNPMNEITDEELEIQFKLVEQLQAFDPKYQEHYPTLEAAAKAGGPESWEAYKTFLESHVGRRISESLQRVPDYATENKIRQLLRKAEISMANKATNGAN